MNSVMISDLPIFHQRGLRIFCFLSFANDIYLEEHLKVQNLKKYSVSDEISTLKTHVVSYVCKLLTSSSV